METTGSGPPGFVRSPDVWFDDGTVILQADTTLFRVYRGVLASQSPVFHDMFAIPQPPAQDSEAYEGCPIIVLQDSPEDLKLFLLATHDAGYLINSPVSGLRILSSLLRISRKYDVEHIRGRMISILRSLYPSSLSPFLHRELPAGYIETRDDDFGALNLALENQVLPVLPGIYYRCCRYSVSALLGAPIDIADKRKCVQAAQIFTEAWAKFIYKGLFRGSPQCARERDCNTARLMWLESHGLPLFGHFFSADFDWGAVGLCDSCTESSMIVYTWKRLQLWEALPSLFDLPPWEQLSKAA